MEFVRKHKNDIALVCALLLLAGGVWLYMRCTRMTGGEAVVTVDGETVHTMPLDTDASYLWRDAAGGENRVEVRGGGVCVTAANCPDHVCIRQGQIRWDGEMIVCLPHRLIVTVVGGAAGTDALTQ